MKTKTKIIASLAIVVILLLAFFSFHHGQSKDITLGTIGDDEKIWNYIAKSKEAKDEGIHLKVKSFTDGVSLNKATAEGTVDVNAFQSYTYLVAYNDKNPKEQLSLLGTTYLEPMGIYSAKYHALDEIPDGGTIAIADNPANTSRGLKLLASAGLIELKSDFGPLSGTNAIKSNPHNFKFKEIDDTTGPRVIKDNDIDAVLIGNTIAQQGHLNVLKDSLYHEKVDQSTKDNVNILASAKDSKKKAEYKKLLKLYHSKDVQNYIKKQFGGTKVEVDKPVSYLQK
ncbi:MetQ/NlpA family ABC transporter substrate-binding protein [Eupransor demetentiae]|uniref:Periplasmic component/surface antigen (NlpA) n=1 Tax=Eupransor demetentiae TaxID=3109584 RepID=A0ABP0ETE9_9LACO|nr:ABC-type metal ion transport system [Lactobacillaceae bacterium LMG 33000]